MVIGVDIDGVLFPWEDAVASAVLHKFGVDLGEMTTWDDYRDRLARDGMSVAWEWLWTPEGSDAVLSQTWRTYPGAIESVRRLMELGHAVHFVTHRDPCATAYNTSRFLTRHFHGLRWQGLHVLRSDVPKRKLHRWDVFIDDKPDTVFDFLANTNATVWSPIRSWNVDELDGVEEPRLGYYDDPARIVEWVERYG